MIERYAGGLLLSIGVAAGARWLRLLTRDGAAAAVVIGTLVFGSGGWRPAALLVLFFLTSSLLTRLHAARKPHPEHIAGRSGAQVIANGAVAAILTVWNAVWPAPWVWTAFAGAIAASTADTWATEIGLLSRTPPRMITTRAIVRPGQSGGMTWLGTAGGVLGAVLLGIAGSRLLQTPALAVAVAGSAAMLFDSLLGATIEGRRGVSNDTVNLVATATGAFLATLLGAA